MPTFPVSWYAIAGLILSNLFTGYMWQQDSHALELVELRSEIASKEAEATLEKQKQITEDTTNGWKAALDNTHDYYAKRMRVANVQPMPGISGPAGGIDAIPADALALASQCAETTLTLRDLQDWIKRQSKL